MARQPSQLPFVYRLGHRLLYLPSLGQLTSLKKTGSNEKIMCRARCWSSATLILTWRSWSKAACLAMHDCGLRVQTRPQSYLAGRCVASTANQPKLYANLTEATSYYACLAAAPENPPRDQPQSARTLRPCISGRQGFSLSPLTSSSHRDTGWRHGHRPVPHMALIKSIKATTSKHGPQRSRIIFGNTMAFEKKKIARGM